MQSKRRAEAEELLKNVKGFMFFNTPVSGLKLADHILCNFSREGALLRSLKLLNKETSVLNEWFRDWRKPRGGVIPAIAIRAKYPTKKVRRVVISAQWHFLSRFSISFASLALTLFYAVFTDVKL
jgi:hypothetical protein